MQRLALVFGSLAVLVVACSSTKNTSSSSSSSGDDGFDASPDAPFTATDEGGKLTPPPSVLSSCNLRDFTGYCLEYANDASGTMATDNCGQANAAQGWDGGASETAGCPTDNRVGSCAATVGGVATTYRYYSPKYTTDSAKADCATLTTNGGTFTPN